MKLSAARIVVDPLAPARRFDLEQLGLELAFDGEAGGYGSFHGGGTRIIVEPVSPDAPEGERVLVGRFLGLSFEVPDLRVAR